MKAYVKPRIAGLLFLIVLLQGALLISRPPLQGKSQVGGSCYPGGLLALADGV